MGSNRTVSYDHSPDGAYADFDYDAIDESLAGRPVLTPDERQAQESGPIPAEVAEGFHAMLCLLYDQLLPKGECVDVRSLGARLLAFLYFARPDSFEGDSLKRVAERSGISRQSITRHAQDFSEAYGFVGRWQHTEEARAKFSAAQQRAKERKKVIERMAEKVLETNGPELSRKSI